MSWNKTTTGDRPRMPAGPSTLAYRQLSAQVKAGASEQRRFTQTLHRCTLVGQGSARACAYPFFDFVDAHQSRHRALVRTLVCELRPPLIARACPELAGKMT